jgi:uncharacterized protein GlcG (DUF336 family)
MLHGSVEPIKLKKLKLYGGNSMLQKLLIASAVLGFLSMSASAQDQQGGNGLLGPSGSPGDAPYGKQRCQIPRETLGQFQAALDFVVRLNNGGIFTPNMMWLAVVDRAGVLCLVIKSTVPETSGSPPDPWPGSRDIAIAKANTANGFSNNLFALSTANLYGPTQPGGSLYGLNNSNPFNPTFNAQGTGLGFVPGGVITFGGGVALYPQLNGPVIGGLGVSGDTSCADHAIAYRVRARLNLNNTPNSDNIVYSSTGTGFTQPNCTNHDIVP